MAGRRGLDQQQDFVVLMQLTLPLVSGPDAAQLVHAGGQPPDDQLTGDFGRHGLVRAGAQHQDGRAVPESGSQALSIASSAPAGYFRSGMKISALRNERKRRLEIRRPGPIISSRRGGVLIAFSREPNFNSNRPKERIHVIEDPSSS